MKVCKIKPNYSTCMACTDKQIDYGQYEDCLKCQQSSEDYELLSVSHGVFGSYAFIIADGILQRVPINQIHCIREV